ncbi:MAG: DUF115 domain-containing protein [Thaumarchaeota archaeon]|nr:DUF115 domain-containing protein [Nitrososphaerota archaeon]
MRVRGWDKKYGEILREFGYRRKDDLAAARFLNSLLREKMPLSGLEQKIAGKTVFIIGAGPSLAAAIPSIKRFGRITKIAADGATKALLEAGIRPDVVVTDLDGNLESLRQASERNSIMVVHSHGDNIGILPIASLFKNCVGTTEGMPFGKVRNFGGFTDGDRCVFLAAYFKAKKIVLFGMDFGKKVGFYSKEGRHDRGVKLEKLAKAKTLLEWLAAGWDGEMYTTSGRLKGFKRIGFIDLYETVKN